MEEGEESQEILTNSRVNINPGEREPTYVQRLSESITVQKKKAFKDNRNELSAIQFGSDMQPFALELCEMHEKPNFKLY